MVVAMKADATKRTVHRRGKVRAGKMPKQVMSALQHFEAAQVALQNDDFKTALKHFQAASDAEAENVEYLDALGAAHAEFGQQEEAIAVLQRAVQLAPDTGYTKYMYLGQLLDGEEALHAMEMGVKALQRSCDQQKEADVGEAGELQEQLCSALCCLAEARLGMAGDVQEVAEACEGLLLRAARASPSSPEPMQVLASLRVEQGRPEEALHSLRQSIATWWPSLQSDAQEGDVAAMEAEAAQASAPGTDRQPEQTGAASTSRASAEKLPLQEAPAEPEHSAKEDLGWDVEDEWETDDSEDEQDDDSMPSYEFRVETAKLLIELDEDNHAAVQVLEMLIAEDDTVPEVWYLLGLALHAGGDFDEALTAAAEAERLVSRRRHEDPGAGETLLDIEDLKAAIQESVVNIKMGTAIKN
ncbi:hypothetical protein CVIRNUC_004166 [Coccomyxa viridis]|uniref:Uncharacterized protein n=1 Tax=Coccomyxa viridis TaxID=1274662 RepID=A0AAV1I0R4_9CHLO|nr:hypothetical protein CVIRNUC_004166 [Coccomyxa viridis]